MAGGTAPSGRPVFDSLLWVLAVWGEKVSVGGVIGFAPLPLPPGAAAQNCAAAPGN